MESIISSAFECLGLGVFIYYLINGLKTRLSALESTINIQSQTLDVMERRVKETEKVGDIYKNLLSDLPKDIDNYKAVVTKTKDATILELTNQHEIAKKQLEEARKQIESSKSSPDVIKRHLRVLRNIMSGPSLEIQPGERIEDDLVHICTFGDRTLEQCVPLIIESQTFEEFVVKAGFKTIRVIDTKFFDDTHFKKNQTPSGAPLVNARASQSITGGWYLMANDEMVMNPIRLNEFKTEFASVKSNP